MKIKTFKYFLIMVLAAVISGSCSGGGGGSGQNDISNISEGDGPAFDITNVNDIVKLVRSIVLDKSYGILKDDSVHFEDEDFATLCSSGSLKTTRETSVGENATMESSVNFNIPQPTLLNGTISSTITYNGHAYNDEEVGKSIVLTGSAAYSSSGEIKLTSGTINQVFCSDEGSDISGIKGTNASSDKSSGSYQISGDFGGAIVYSISGSITLTAEAGDTPTNYSFSGRASFKSHDQIAECTISREYDMEGYMIECM